MDKFLIKNRLRAYAECCDIHGAYLEANCMFEAIEYINTLESVADTPLSKFNIEDKKKIDALVHHINMMAELITHFMDKENG